MQCKSFLHVFNKNIGIFEKLTFENLTKHLLTTSLVLHNRTKTVEDLKAPKTKIAEFANMVDLDEMAHDEPPHQYAQCLSASVVILIFILLGSFETV